MNLGPHAFFILASYAVAALVFFGLIAWLVTTGRRHRRTIAVMEARGVKRRSDTAAKAGDAA
jgi:heme exporter protein D